MKKLAYISSLLVLGSSVVATSANALSLTKGQSPCGFVQNTLLPMAGYSEGGIYTREQIQQMLTKMDIDLGEMQSIQPGVSYKLTYDCTIQNQMGINRIYATPTSTMSGQLLPTSILTWKQSKLSVS